jgi:high affinity sulfate transporter 1
MNTRLAPGLEQLRRYERGWLRGDLVAGVTVAAYLIPQVMAYAKVAGLQPVAGLWAVIGSMAIYAVVGSSPQLSVGPESTTALMTATAIAPLAAGEPDRYAALAAALALIVALYALLGWVARLGFLADLLSKPVLIGYLAGVAVIMIAGQLDSFSGVEVEGNRALEEIRSFVTNLDQIHGPTIALSSAVLATLFVGSKLFPRAPIPLLAILGAAAVVKIFDLGANGLELVGSVPTGLPSPQFPDVSRGDLTDLLLPAIGVTVVAYTDNTLEGRAFASRNRYEIDANQEFLALAAANVAAGASQGFPVSSSGSRTVIGDSLGSRTQLYSLVVVLIVILTLLFLGPVLETFPQAALAAIVMWAAVKLVDVPGLRRLAAFRWTEFLLAISTTAAVLIVDILYGVLVAIGLSILELLHRVARPHDGVLGYAPGVPGMHDIDDYPDARQVPGLLVYRYDSPLFFANAQNFKQRALASVDERTDVEWLLLNFEANVHVDLTSVDVIGELLDELDERDIALALARVKRDTFVELEQAGLIDRIGADHVFETLPTAVVAFVDHYQSVHGHPPPGIVPPEPPQAPIID